VRDGGEGLGETAGGHGREELQQAYTSVTIVSKKGAMIGNMKKRQRRGASRGEKGGKFHFIVLGISWESDVNLNLLELLRTIRKEKKRRTEPALEMMEFN